MRLCTYAAFVAALTLVGCGSGDESAEREVVPSRSSPSTAAPVVSEPITIDEPSEDGTTIDQLTYVVRGRSTYKRLLVTNIGGSRDVSNHPDSGDNGYPEYRVEVRSDGTWSQRVPIFKGANQIYAEDSGENESVDIDIYRETGGTPPSTKAGAKSAKKKGPSREERYRTNLRKLLTEKGAVGKTAAAVRDALGAPDSPQSIGGQRFWYYQKYNGGGTYQVVIEGKIVIEVNTY